MKKLSILALAAILVIFFTLPAAALENEFGGYWRTRFYSQKYFTGYDRGDKDGTQNAAGEDNRADDDTVELTDTRTRLYYTAKINDNLKFVNKFEYDAVWGDKSPSSRNYGRVGADGVDLQIKNSYADFNMGPVNFTVGVQPYSLFRDFQISDDASGIIARWQAMDNFILAASWLKAFEGSNASGTDGDQENEDLDTYTLTGAFWFDENISLKPSISTSYADQLNAGLAQRILGGAAPVQSNIDFSSGNFSTTYLVSMGADFDMTFEKWGMWVTGFYQTGEVQDVNTLDSDGNSTGDQEDFDISAGLIAAGANVGFGEVGFLGDFGLHGEGFYASGDSKQTDDDINGVVSPFGSYYWSEIMGLGIFDNRASSGSPADKISNIWAVNLGVDMKPMDKLKMSVDLWYAELVESDSSPTDEDKLGTELDATITYQLVEGLNLDVVGAYLWADDATAASVRDNQEDPYEIGARISLSF